MNKIPSVVFDTNVYISGLLFTGGRLTHLVEQTQEGCFDLYYSPAIIEEIKKVLTVKFEWDLNDIDRLIKKVERMGEVVYPTTKIDVVKTDETDNRILECALACNADYVITGDKKHLIGLKHPFNFKIVSPSEFYQIIFSV